MQKCKICGREFKSIKGLSQHILKHNMSSNEYFDKYIKKSNDGICMLKNCNNKTTYISLNIGYRKYCCSDHAVKCENYKKNKSEKMKQIFNDDHYRSKLSIGSKKFWNSKNGLKLKKKYSKERKHKKRPDVSEIIRKRLMDKKIRKKHLKAINDPTTKEKRSISMKKAWEKEEVRENYRIGRQTKKVYEGHKKQRKYMLNGGAAHARSFIRSPSLPQLELFKIIKTIFSVAQLEYKILNYNVDIAIPQLKIAFEYDGSYWHQNKKIENERQTKIEKLGWQFIRYIDYIPSKNQIIKDMNNFLYREV